MKTITQGYIGPEVEIICKTLGLHEDNTYTARIEEKVKEYQGAHGLKVDGVVGPLTWFPLLYDHRLMTNDSREICESDLSLFSDVLCVSKAALKSVLEVETGGKGGFLESGRCRILFEAHIFYKLLKKRGLDPDELSKTHPGIIARKWNKTLYKGGEDEWDRLTEAMEINEEAALESASWGIFQVMGFNFRDLGCSSVYEMVDMMGRSEFSQFILGLKYMITHGLIKYLQKKDWAGFAMRYNGPGYKQNNYDVKLERAYMKYC